MHVRTNTLAIQIVDSPALAPNYSRDEIDTRAVTIDKAIVVKKGTQSGKTTVDFQIVDQQGAKFVAMLTGALVLNLAEIIKAAEGGKL